MATRLILPLSENPSSSITKPRLLRTLNELAEEFNKIHALYEHFFSTPKDRQALAQQIEEKLEQIKKKHAELFRASEGELSKIAELESAIEKINDYRKKLLEGDGSIQADIKDSQDKITDFFNKLFSSYEKDDDGGQEAKLKAAFQSIVSFDESLNKADVGYRVKIEKARTEILAAHKNLLDEDKKSGLSKVSVLNKHITEANDFHQKLKKEIDPFINERQVYINDIAKDIEAKRHEVDSLLSETTVKALAQGYREAMQIYGDPVYGAKETGWWNGLQYLVKSLARAIKHFIKFIGAYILFIGPLVIIGWLFVSNGWQSMLNITQDGAIRFSGTEYIFYKLTVALPLLWVSWYGQRNISHRKRLFEEYNHKLRVVQMYMHFVGNDSTYTLDVDSRKRLEETLLATIERNPSDVYGKDATLLDKLISILQRTAKDSSSSTTDSIPTKSASK